MSTRFDREPAAIVVAHGLPSSPGRQETRMQDLAAGVSALANMAVAGTTLAMPGGLDAAVRAVGSGALVYPLFIADGWFVSDELPRRLAEAGAVAPLILDPYGMDAAVRALALRRVAEAVPDPAGTAVLVAAHGSPGDPRPARAAREAADVIAKGGFREVRCGFVDEAPFLADAARDMGPAVCLPYFARRAGHVTVDLPEALERAGFDGRVLDPIGEDPETPAIIARSLWAAAAERASGSLAPL